MATVTVPLATLNTEQFPVLNVANGIVPDEALAIPITLSFTPSVTAMLIDVTESALKFNTIPIQGVYIDMSAATMNLSLQIPGSGQMILAKSGTQGYYAVLSPMPVRVIVQLSAAPAAALNLQIILYNTPIEPCVWGYAQGPIGPQGPPGPQGPSGGAYTLPPATATVLGGVKVDGGLNVLGDGTLSVAAATASVVGGVKAGAGVNIAADGTLSVPVLAPATATVLGGVKIGSNVNVLGDGTISVPPVAAFQTPWLTTINGANNNLINVNTIGVGTSSPLYRLDVRTATSNTPPQVHVSATDVDSGMYLLSGGPDGASLLGGASWNGTNWIAKATNAQLIQMNSGNIDFYIDTGLTVAATYTPTFRARITSSGMGIVAPAGPGITPAYPLDVRTGTHGTVIHLSAANADDGGYLMSGSPDSIYIVGGGSWNGTTWTAKAANVTALYLVNGLLQVGVNPGTTPGASYTPAGAILTVGNVGLGLGVGVGIAHLLELNADSAAKPSTSTWTISSGAKVKRHVKNLKGGLEIINKLRPTEAEYNGKGGTPEGQRVVSLIAEEVREVLPHTVTEDAEGNLGFNVHEVIHHLILAVQQLSAEVKKRK